MEKIEWVRRDGSVLHLTDAGDVYEATLLVRSGHMTPDEWKRLVRRMAMVVSDAPTESEQGE